MRALCLFSLFSILSLSACGNDEDTSPGTGAGGTGGSSSGGPSYGFDSRFSPGESSVSHSGQSARQVLISELGDRIGGLSERIDTGALQPTSAGDVTGGLNLFFVNEGDVLASEPLSFSLGETPLSESTLGDISADKNLIGKLAGNDSVTDHADWAGGAFQGWSSNIGGLPVSSPQSLVEGIFAQIELNALGRVNGVERLDPAGNRLPVHITESGLDLEQLTLKFLLMAVNFSQGSDDYLDDDVDGKGLLSPNTQDEDKAYTKLEHAWDEGFGYFGATRDYDDYSDDEIAGKGGRPEYQGFHDTNEDGKISVKSEVLFHAALNAGKRDRGSIVATDFSADVFSGFLAGRQLIADAGETLGDDELQTLAGHRDQVVTAWEKAMAATVVHYINEVLVDMAAFGGDDYAFIDHAKRWSELKGFALGLQFNPRSPLHADGNGQSDVDFVELHQLLGDAPTLGNAEPSAISAYQSSLLEARTLLGQAYGFATENLGDSDGLGGW